MLEQGRRGGVVPMLSTVPPWPGLGAVSAQPALKALVQALVKLGLQTSTPPGEEFLELGECGTGPQYACEFYGEGLHDLEISTAHRLQKAVPSACSLDATLIQIPSMSY